MRAKRLATIVTACTALGVMGSMYGFQVIGPCPQDLDGDREVGTTDFLQLIAAWGTDPGGPPDFNCREHNIQRDQVVDSLDFLDLLMHWGECD